MSRDGSVVAQTDASPTFASHPPNRWRSGERVLDRRRIVVPSDLRGGTVQLSVAVGDSVVPLGVVDIEGVERSFDVPHPLFPVNRAFAGVGDLVGFDLAPEGECRLDTADGDPPRLEVHDAALCRIRLTLYWRAQGGTETDLKVFNHVVDAAGVTVGQHDGEPDDGARPTSGWAPGEYISDTHTLTFADAAPAAGPGALDVGLYDPATMKRILTADGADQVTLGVQVSFEGR